MTKIRKRHGGAFKAKVAFEAIKENKTLNEIAKEFSIHPLQVGKWKKELIEHASELFIDHRLQNSKMESEILIKSLYEQIGKLKVENDFLKKKTEAEW